MAKTTKKTKKKAAKTRRTTKKSPRPWNQVNRLQLAELLGVHPDTVSDYSRGGMPVIRRGGRGLESQYNAVECLAWWRAQQGHNAKEAAQTRALEAQARLNELKLSRQKEELYPRQEILLAGQACVKAWAAKIRALPRQMVQAGVITAGEQEQRTASLVRHVLSEIGSWKPVKSSTSKKK